MSLTIKQSVLFGALGFIIMIVLSIGLGLYISIELTNKEFKSYTGGVATNGHECAAIGSSILEKGGSAVDAAIAALFCEGVAMPQSMGLGGGFLMNIYIRENRTAEILDARETAPIKATGDMFSDNASLALTGGLAVAVPGELRGYEYAHRKYGKLPWKDLVQPTIELCERGHLVTKFLAKFFKSQESALLSNPTLKEIFIDEKTNEPYKEGQYIKRKKLAETLRIIADDKSKALYNGRLTEGFIDDITKMGGIITTDDLNMYQPKWRKPIVAELPFNETLYTCPLPGSGIILTFILNVLKEFLDYSNFNAVFNWQRIIESFKHAHAKRHQFGDPDFLDYGVKKFIETFTSDSYAALIREKITNDRTFNNSTHYGGHTFFKEDHGTAHISVVAPNGDAVSVTSSINQYFGASFRSTSTGIILNDQMGDFSLPNKTNNFNIPPSIANYIAPHKRPMSSMSPSIVINKHGDAILVIGAAGGPKITTAIALVDKESLSRALSASRVHHQLLPMVIELEPHFDKNIMAELQRLGHNISIVDKHSMFGALTVLGRRNGQLEGNVDWRRGGQVVLIK